MKIEFRLKGSLAQAVVKSVFQHWQYRVIPFGVEETLREIAALDESKYKEVRLPPVMRSMPDYVIASNDMRSVRLVEVKYRRRWSDKIKNRIRKDLHPQTTNWGEIVVVFIFAMFLEEGPCIKCIRIKNSENGNELEFITPAGSRNWNELDEKNFSAISEIFPELDTDTQEFKKALQAVVSAEQRLDADPTKPVPIAPKPSISDNKGAAHPHSFQTPAFRPVIRIPAHKNPRRLESMKPVSKSTAPPQ